MASFPPAYQPPTATIHPAGSPEYQRLQALLMQQEQAGAAATDEPTTEKE